MVRKSRELARGRGGRGARSWRSVVGWSGVAVGLAVASAAVAAAVISVLVARTVVTPPRRREEDVRILAAGPETITLSATLDTLTPGRYSLWFSNDTGHALIGEILGFTERTVTRELLAVDFGDIVDARSGRISGWFYLSPAELDLPWEDVTIETELGPAPAWLIPSAQPTGRWVIQVHGRAVRRQECLRAVPAFHAAGYTALVISYRNDGDAPRSADYRYALGDTEWHDVESAMRYAVEHGATEIVLMGWSMGGATVLQTLTRSELSERVRAVVLDSPVVDWVTALEYQGASRRLPPPIRAAAIELLSTRWGGLLTGQSTPVDFARLDLVARASDLAVPILLFHSVDDGYIPVTGSDALAAERPDIVTYERFATARHTKLWNYDHDRWERAISDWLEWLDSTSE